MSPYIKHENPQSPDRGFFLYCSISKNF